MVLGSLGSSFFHPQAIGFINSFSKLNCSRNMGIFVGMGSLGFALGPLLTAYIAQTLGLEKICITGFFGITIALFMFLFVPKLSCSTENIEKKEFLKSFKEIFSNSQINYLMIISMMKSLVTNSSCILLPFLWQSLGYSPFYIGLALFLFIFAGAIGSLISPYIEKALSSKIIILVSMWLPFPLMLAFSLVYKTQPTFSLILFALIGFITMLAQPVTLVLAQKTLPKYKSIVAGLINGFCWGTVALCLSFLGVVAQKYGIMDVLVILTFLPISASWIVLKLREN
jgi:FSR family fosmidomycin resistance protein-like MFS transporter